MEKDSIESWFSQEQLNYSKVINRQLADHIIFGISGVELTENSIRNMELGEVEEVINGQTNKEANKENCSGT